MICFDFTLSYPLLILVSMIDNGWYTPLDISWSLRHGAQIIQVLDEDDLVLKPMRTWESHSRKPPCINIWVVVWLPFFMFPYIGFLIIPIDFHIFQRGGPTTNQILSWGIQVLTSHVQGTPQLKKTWNQLLIFFKQRLSVIYVSSVYMRHLCSFMLLWKFNYE